MNIGKYLEAFLEQTVKILDAARLPNGYKQSTYQFNCAQLDDYNKNDNDNDIRHSKKCKNIFDKVKADNGPTVYWFEITSSHSNQIVVDAFNHYKNNKPAKATPAIKKGALNNNSRILYVGKVKNDFSGRLIQHLGFYAVAGTQGLQLFHWAKSISLELRIHTIVFLPAMKDILPIIEYAVAQKLNPIIGKHK